MHFKKKKGQEGKNRSFPRMGASGREEDIMKG
jgi:hypothetical protein